MGRCYGFCVGAMLVLFMAGMMPGMSMNASAEYQERTMCKRGVYGVDLTDWYVYSIGGLSEEVTRDVAVVSGTYDASNTVPNSIGWNGHWLVSDESFIGGLDFSATVTVNSATGTEWMAGIGVVMSESASVQLENSITWGSRIYTSSGENAIGFYYVYNPYHSQGTLDPTDVVLGQSVVYRMVAYEGLVALYVNGNLCGSLALDTDELNVFLYSAVKYEGTSMSVTFDSVTVM